jgi:serine/threonine protein kinase
MQERYVKKQQLGVGGQGSVWLVEDKNTGSLAAMKLYPKGDESAIRERGILHRFGGKGVPYLLDYLELEEETAVVMEYVEGKSLRQLMQEKKIRSEKEGIQIAMETAKILSMFHRQTPVMIYGDLKPDNIMLNKEGQVSLVDFGSVLYEGERDRKVFGTGLYLPPSQEGKVTPYRDTYGLGVILYEMLTGYRLEEGLCNGKADISHLNRYSREVMQKAVRLHETEGYPDAGQMYIDLKACCEILKEGQKMKKRGRRTEQRKNHYIGDVKRLMMHGYSRALCLAPIGLIIIQILVGGLEMEHKEKKDKQIEQVTHMVQTEIWQEVPEKVSTKDSDENISRPEVLRDEYGRKVLVRNLTDGKETAYNIP